MLSKFIKILLHFFLNYQLLNLRCIFNQFRSCLTNKVFHTFLVKLWEAVNKYKQLRKIWIKNWLSITVFEKCSKANHYFILIIIWIWIFLKNQKLLIEVCTYEKFKKGLKIVYYYFLSTYKYRQKDPNYTTSNKSFDSSFPAEWRTTTVTISSNLKKFNNNNLLLTLNLNIRKRKHLNRT